MVYNIHSMQKEKAPIRESSEQETSPEQIAEMEAARLAAESLRAITIRGGSEVEIVLSDEPDYVLRRRIIEGAKDKSEESETVELSTQAGLGQAIFKKKQGEKVTYLTADNEQLVAEIILVDNTKNAH